MSTFSKKLPPIPEDLNLWENKEMKVFAIEIGANIDLDENYSKAELKTIIHKMYNLPPLQPLWHHRNKGELIDICNNANIKYCSKDTRVKLINKIRLKYGVKKRDSRHCRKQKKKKSKKRKQVSKKKSSSKKLQSIEVDNDSNNISVISNGVTESKPKKSSSRKKKNSKKPKPKRDSSFWSKKAGDLIIRDGDCCQGCPGFCPYDSLSDFLRKKEAVFRQQNPNGNFEIFKPKLTGIWLRGIQYDHIHEWDDNGPDILENIQMLCYACHSVKTSHYNSDNNKNLSFEERRDLDDNYRYMTRSVAEKQRDLELRVNT